MFPSLTVDTLLSKKMVFWHHVTTVTKVRTVRAWGAVKSKTVLNPNFDRFMVWLSKLLQF